MFSHTMPSLAGEEAEEKLAARGISVVDGEVASLKAVEDASWDDLLQRHGAARGVARERSPYPPGLPGDLL
ncbi:hypothetical protein Pme01_55560 [Planosporangium mesophilum]|uniref:Uncharacterized protein n=2 Tax=Planosporangium mesophilum TaxID=689768 RepID=A0A8J3TGQ4_9ACTN|nr:hypothetical protein Pme01_55560 [Planosporangium mesophilum]